MALKEALVSSDAIVAEALAKFRESEAVRNLGLDVLALSLVAIKPTPETSRALEAEAREALQRRADEAIYARRNAAVEQERLIKESELNTEIAVEEKKKQIDEKRMEAEVQKAENDRKLREMNIDADIAIEKQRELLIEQKTANERKEAETRGFVLETTLKPYKDIDWKTLTALQNHPDPRIGIALAFRELAENADKIGNLNISPELLETLLDKRSRDRE